MDNLKKQIQLKRTALCERTNDEMIRKNIHVVAAIIHKERKIFATQRGYGEFKDGWEFPGGKLEPGETQEEALKREIREELNAEIHIEKFFHRVEYDYPKFHLTMDCYLCTIKEGTITLLEHEASKWLTKDCLNEVQWLPADEELIELLKRSTYL